MYSTLTRESYVMVRLDPAFANPGIKLEVRGKNVTCAAVTHAMPFLDPNKDKRTQ